MDPARAAKWRRAPEVALVLWANEARASRSVASPCSVRWPSRADEEALDVEQSSSLAREVVNKRKVPVSDRGEKPRLAAATVPTGGRHPKDRRRHPFERTFFNDFVWH
jgi:hypothetical protein